MTEQLTGAWQTFIGNGQVNHKTQDSQRYVENIYFF